MTRYCVKSMDQKWFEVYDKKTEEAVVGSGSPSWEQTAREVAKWNEMLEKSEKGKR